MLFPDQRLADIREGGLAIVSQSNVRPDKESNLRALAELARESSKPFAMFSMITQSINDYGLKFKLTCRLPFLQGAGNMVQTMRHLAMFGEAVQAERRGEERSRAARRR